MLIRQSGQSSLTLKRVASNGSMAPCRSHHGNHTRQEWIIIWSGRNWILKHANLILNSFHVHDLHQKIHRRRGFDEIIQIHRRHGRRNNPNNRKYYRRHDLGENTEEGSDAAELIVNVKIDSRLRQQCSKRTCQMKRQGGSWVIHIPSRKHNLMQVRPAGQAGYPISLVASLDTVPVKCCVPLH